MASELGDLSERADRAMPEAAARRGARSRVLVVDDEPEIVAYLREALERLGYEISSARDGREALERVAAQQPDPILFDCVMPRMRGVAVCQVLSHPLIPPMTERGGALRAGRSGSPSRPGR